MLKKILFSSIVGLALVAFTGCTGGNDTASGKCGEGKCDSGKKVETKCDTGKCGEGKCG